MRITSYDINRDLRLLVGVFNEPVGDVGIQREAVRQLLAAELGFEPLIDHRADGSAVIKGLGREISISHCRGGVAVALGGNERIGVDIEQWRTQLERVKERFLSKPELEWTMMQPERLLLAWTAKEAAYKAAGIAGLPLAEGITLDAENQRVTIQGGGRYEIHSATVATEPLAIMVTLVSPASEKGKS